MHQFQASKQYRHCLSLLCALALVAPMLPSLARSESVSSSPLLLAISDYRAAKSGSRYDAANKLRQTLERVSKAEIPVEMKAEATILLSDFAMSDGKKDLALKLTRDGQALLKGSVSPNTPSLLALAARVEARALLADQERLAALETIVKARLAYGAPKPAGGSQWDPQWDHLAMWQSIAMDELHEPERIKGAAIIETMLKGSGIEGNGIASCSVDYDRITRLNTEVRKPEFPAVPWLVDEVGGVFMRLNVDVKGKVTDTAVTAFSNSEEFVDRAEDAARKWKFSVPTDVNPACLQGRPQVFLYAFDDRWLPRAKSPNP